MARSFSAARPALWALALVVAAGLHGCIVVDETPDERTSSPAQTPTVVGIVAPTSALGSTRTPTPEPARTATRRPTRTPTVTASPTPTREAAIESLDDIPEAAGRPFTLCLSEEELNERLADADFGDASVSVTNPRFTLLEEGVAGRFDVRQAEYGIAFEIALHGQPNVAGGSLYLQVEDTEIEGVGGLTRVLISGQVEQTVESLSTEHGILVPLEELGRVTLDSAELEPGALVLTGITR